MPLIPPAKRRSRRRVLSHMLNTQPHQQPEGTVTLINDRGSRKVSQLSSSAPKFPHTRRTSCCYVQKILDSNIWPAFFSMQLLELPDEPHFKDHFSESCAGQAAHKVTDSKMAFTMAGKFKGEKKIQPSLGVKKITFSGV